MPASIEQSFSWAQWTPNTSLTLCNVPWDSSYRDVVRFKDDVERQRYFSSLPSVDVEHATMHKFGQPVLLEIPFNEASGWNYLIAFNDYPSLEVPRRWYYFIQSVEYVNAHTTRMNIMLDVWQSFLFDWTLGRSYIVRGHIGIANDKSFKNYGRDYLTYPEGLDTGSNMLTKHQEFAGLIERLPQNPGATVDNTAVWNYGVIIASTTSLSADAGTRDNPKLKSAGGNLFENCVSGAEYYYIPSYIDAVFALSHVADYSWVSQGIIKIYMVPAFLKNFFLESGEPLRKMCGHDVNFTYYHLILSPNRASIRNPSVMTVRAFRTAFQLPNRYAHLKKMLTYPYACIEMTCNNGQSMTIRPELISSDDLTIKASYSLTAANSRIQYYVPDYNCDPLTINRIVPIHTYDGGDAGTPLDGGEQFAASVGIQDLPSFMVVNNGAALSLANSAYTRAYAAEAAQWTADKAHMAYSLSREQARTGVQYDRRRQQAGISNTSAMADIAANNMSTSAAIAYGQMTAQSDLAGTNNVVQGAAGVVGNALSGNWGGVAQSVVGAGMAEYNRQRSLSIAVNANEATLANNLSTNAATARQSNTYASQTNRANNEQALQFSDMNYELASATMQGDYENAISGINAQVQQMQLTPPTTSGQAGGDIFNLDNGVMGLQLKFKTCEPSALIAVGEYFLRYGYFVQRFVIPPKDLKCMTKFTYWKMAEAYVSASRMPEQYRMTVKGIFEAGTTVWTRPGDIGNIDYADNKPLSGISY